jgi:hypothetical protein
MKAVTVRLIVPPIFYPIRVRLMYCGRGLRREKNLDIRFTLS